MPNWCSTNWIIKGEEAAVRDFAEKCNSLKEKEVVESNSFGKNWLGNLFVTLGYEPKMMNTVNARGYIDSNGYAPACLFCGRPDDEPFTITTNNDGTAQLRFTTISAWGLPDWLDEHFQRMEEELERFVFDYKATDEFGNFHVCRTGELIGDIYEIYNPKKGEWFSYGMEDKTKFVEKVAELTGEKLDVPTIVRTNNFRELRTAVYNYNEALNNEDNEIEMTIFEID